MAGVAAQVRHQPAGKNGACPKSKNVCLTVAPENLRPGISATRCPAEARYFWVVQWLRDQSIIGRDYPRRAKLTVLANQLESGAVVDGYQISVELDLIQDRVILRGCSPTAVDLLSNACRALGFPFRVERTPAT